MLKRTFQNFSRTAHKYGDIHFISFLGSVLARLAYLNDNNFLPNYEQIMGPVVPIEAMEAINAVPANNLKALLDDQTLFGLLNPKYPFKNYTYDFEGKKYIDFVKMNMPQKINAINGEVTSYLQKVNPSGQVTYISLHWSNYGEVYIVADKRMRNTIFVLFRGTYSAKTFALYAKPTSVIPLKICDTQPDTFLYGIEKAALEMIHTITESIRYLAVNVLNRNKEEPDSVKIFTAGQSLGGAMCTDFTYLWTKAVKSIPLYNSGDYAIISKNVICVSLGSPRTMGNIAAKTFCDMVKKGQVLYLRITSRGDPIPGVPTGFGYEHPCSSDETMRKQVVEDCNSLLTMRPMPNVKYEGNLDCTNYKTRVYMPNILSHVVYLDIMYTRVMNPINFMRGIGTQREITRNKAGSTFARIILGTNNNYKQIFFNVDAARTVLTNDDLIEEKRLETQDATNLVTQEITSEQKQAQAGGEVAYKVNPQSFDKLKQQANQLKQQAAPIVQQAKQQMTNAKNQAAPIVRNAYQKAAPIVTNAIQQAAPIVRNAYQKAAPIVTNAIQQAAPIVRNAYQKAAPIVTNAIQQAKQQAVPKTTSLWQRATQQVSNIKQRATQQVNNMQQQANNAIQKQFGKKVVEDSKMTAAAFDSLINLMKVNTLPDKAPLQGEGGPDADKQGMYAPNSVFANQLAPEVGCFAVPGKGGKKSKKRKSRRNRRTRRRKRI